MLEDQKKIKAREASARFRAKNIERLREEDRVAARLRRSADPEANRKLSRERYWRDPDKARQQARESGSRRVEKIMAYQADYKANNLEKVRAWQTAYAKKMREENVEFRLKDNLRSRLNAALRKSVKLGSAVKDLGCTVEELKAHLENQFLPGMSWDNYGRKGWHVDHIKPLCSFNLTVREEFAAASHYTNLQPLWATDNLRKGGKTPTSTKK